jgi:biotin carboxyl carrier protein
VQLAAAFRADEDAPLRVAPASEPLRMTNPTVGRGILGGVAGEVAPQPASVLAQRHWREVDGEPRDVQLVAGAHGRHTIVEDGVGTRVILEPAMAAESGVQRREILVHGFRFEVETESERIASLRERASRGRAASGRAGPLEVKAIIPGKVVAVSVAPGDEVTAGQQLLVVEAMKMQNELRAPRDGTISRVGVVPGANIELGDLLVVIS